MGFASFAGRVFFASIFILSAWQMFNEFGVDGGPAAKELIPKLGLARNIYHLNSIQLVAMAIALEGLGSILFVFGHEFGALLLFVYLLFSTPLLYDFYNYSPDESQYNVLLGGFLQCVAQCGALIFFMGMKNSVPKRQPRKRGPKQKTT